MQNEMRDRLIKLIEDILDKGFNEHKPLTSQFLTGELITNGVIFPPCKVGDTVYRFNDHIWYEDCGHCEYFRIGGFGDPHECGKTEGGRKSAECISISEETATLNDILYYLQYDLFGESAFLSREEAEKKLEEMKNG